MSDPTIYNDDNYRKSNLHTFSANATLTDLQLVGATLYGIHTNGLITLQLPNASGIFANILPDNVYVGMQFSLVLMTKGPKTTLQLSNSADGSCILSPGIMVAAFSTRVNYCTPRVCACIVTSLNPTDPGAITIY